MATVKKSKKKVIVPICIVLVIAIIAGAIFGVVKSKSGEEVTLYTIATDDIHETVSLTGDVSSGAKKEYKVGTVATVKEVFVNVGDEVKKGDVLATFDTSSLDAQVASLQSAYDDARDSYNDAVETQKSAKEKANSINKEISKLESRINKLEKQVNKTTTAKTTTKKATTAATTAPSTTSKGQQILSSALATTTTKPATTTTTAPSTTVDDGSPKYAVNASAYPNNLAGTVTGGGVFPQTQKTTLKATPNNGYVFFGWYTSNSAILAGENPVSTSRTIEVSYTDKAVLNYYAVFVENSTTSGSEESTTASASVDDIVSTLKTLNDNIASITNDVQTMTALTQVVATSISNAISSGQLNSQTIAKLVGEDVKKAIHQGIVDSTKLLVEEDVAVRMIQSAVSSIDFAALAKGVADSDNAKLTGAQIQLASLYAQYEIYNTQSKDTVTDAQKRAVDASKLALDTMKEQQTALAEGWKADFDGVITAVDITPGASTTMVSSGITLENLGKMVVNVSLGEYDLHKVKLGMKATVTTAYGTYEGEVATIAPTATGGSSSSILDSVGSMAGISGLSSLTDSGAGVECTVTIDNPDENITVGFDADVEIETGVYENVTVVPIESIEMEKNGSYVYVYNEEEGTATKTLIKTGAISDTAYQVTDGLKPGDKIVATPSADYKEDTFKVKVVDSKNK
ncbi:MAG: biotin/lipoyl-binding protein [Eubacteriales bacterium]|nr:biotin/lipoyl-binding protein [Eubacteriales bacterium]